MGFWNWIFGKTRSARCQFPDWVCGKKDFSILLWANFADGKDENSHARLLVVQDESTTSDRSSGSAYENLSKALVSKTHLIRRCSKWAFFADGSGLGFYFEDPVNGPACLRLLGPSDFGSGTRGHFEPLSWKRAPLPGPM